LEANQAGERNTSKSADMDATLIVAIGDAAREQDHFFTLAIRARALIDVGHEEIISTRVKCRCPKNRQNRFDAQAPVGQSAISFCRRFAARLPGVTSTDHAELTAARRRIAELEIHRRAIELFKEVVLGGRMRQDLVDDADPTDRPRPTTVERPSAVDTGARLEVSAHTVRCPPEPP
jgi:hypothetical protein